MDSWYFFGICSFFSMQCIVSERMYPLCSKLSFHSFQCSLCLCLCQTETDGCSALSDCWVCLQCPDDRTIQCHIMDEHSRYGDNQRFIEKQKAEWKHIPPAVSQYLVKLLVPVTVFVMLGLLTLIPDTVMTAMTVPLQVLVYALSTLPSILIIIGLTCYFWIKGIHGVSILGTILRPFWTQMLLMNLYAVLTKNEIMYIGSEAFYQWFVWIGGSGATFGLCIVCYLFGKSKQMQALKANALSSAVFNINEEVIFGMPIVENRYLKIPFFAVSMISGCVAWVLMRTGYIPVPHVLAPWIAPFFIGSMLTSGISLRVLMVSLGLVLFSALCYLPFFLWYDARLLKEEK